MKNRQLKLIFIARKSGGEFVRVLSNTTPETAVNQIGKPSFGFVSASYDQDYISEVYPSIPTAIQGTNFKIAGKIIAKDKKMQTMLQLVHILYLLQKFLRKPHSLNRITVMAQKLHTKFNT